MFLNFVTENLKCFFREKADGGTSIDQRLELVSFDGEISVNGGGVTVHSGGGKTAKCSSEVTVVNCWQSRTILFFFSLVVKEFDERSFLGILP